MKRITITAYAGFNIQDIEGFDLQVPGTTNSMSYKAGDVKSITVTERAYDARIQPQLDTLSMDRVRLVESNVPVKRTGPVMTYTLENLPDQRPLIDRVIGSPLDLSAPAGVTIVGRNLIPGLKANASVGTGTGLLTVTAVRKGPQGNRVSVVILPGSASPSVAWAVDMDGRVVISVTPTVAQRADLIAAQINGNAFAAMFLSATSGGTGKVLTQTLKLTGGAGSGMAWLVVPASATSWLLIEATKPGNDANGISVKILADTGAGAVTVSGNAITVTPAAGETGAAELATLINGTAAARALVKCTATGTTDIVPGTVGQSYLYGGSGEPTVVTIGGAVAAVTTHTDTSLVLAVTNALLAAAGVVATDHVTISLKLGGRTLSAQIPMQA
jgi:hypothetical protein